MWQCWCVSPSGPLPPQNLSLSHVTTNSAQITWSRHPRSIPDGFVVNVTRGLNTRSRFLPNGKLGSYTLRELTPGQHYYVALTSVRNTGQEQIHSRPQHLAFTTCECLWLEEERLTNWHLINAQCLSMIASWCSLAYVQSESMGGFFLNAIKLLTLNSIICCKWRSLEVKCN